MNRFLRWFFVGTLCGMLAPAPMLKAEDAAALTARLQAAAADSSLDAQGIAPWHLKVTFQLFDEQGKPEQGTMEEWWSAPSVYKLSVVSPSYTAAGIRNQKEVFRTNGAGPLPYALRALYRALVHPMPREEELTGTRPELFRKTCYKVKMDCIALNQVIKGNPEIPLGLFPTYCLDRDKNTLRVSYDAGMLEAVRVLLGEFQQRSVPIDLTIVDGNRKLVSSHIVTLTTDMTGASFTPTPDMAKISGLEVVTGSSGIVAGRKLSGPPPSYPESARSRHISGAVVLKARIGPDGHIADLRVISTPDGDLAVAALSAVHFWVYKPYLLNGVPVNVDTTITVNFNIN